MNSELENIRRYFGVYGKAPKFDTSVNALLGLGLPEGAVREIVSGIWREGWDAGHAEGFYEE